MSGDLIGDPHRVDTISMNGDNNIDVLNSNIPTAQEIPSSVINIDAKEN